MNKTQLWPKEGKLKKGLIILGFVIILSFLITLLEEKTNIKMGKRLPLIIALSVIAIWLYNPTKPTKNA